jgi:hypothetical protein
MSLLLDRADVELVQVAEATQLEHDPTYNVKEPTAASSGGENWRRGVIGGDTQGGRSQQLPLPRLLAGRRSSMEVPFAKEEWGTGRR